MLYLHGKVARCSPLSSLLQAMLLSLYQGKCIVSCHYRALIALMCLDSLSPDITLCFIFVVAVSHCKCVNLQGTIFYLN